MSSEEIWSKKFTLDYPGIGLVYISCSDATGQLTATLPVLEMNQDGGFKACKYDIDAGATVRGVYGACIGTYGWRHKGNPIPTVNCSIEKDCDAAAELKRAIMMITEHGASHIYPYLSYGIFDGQPYLFLVIARTKNKEANMPQEKPKTANEATKRRLTSEIDRLNKNIQEERVRAKEIEKNFEQKMSDIYVYEAQLEGVQLALNRLTDRTHG